MGANSSPPASDAVVAAAAAAALKTKKRKTSDAPLPIGLSFTSSDNGASGAASPAGTPTEHDAESLHTQATLERMATALDLSHSLVDRALLDPTLPKSTSLTMEDSRSRLEQLSAFMDALRAADVDGVARQLQLMFVSDVGVLSTLRDAASRSVDDANKANNTVELLSRTRRISSASAPPPPTNADTTKTNETNKTIESPRDPNTGPSVEADGDVNMEAGEQSVVRDSLHENEAAQALTGLRLSSTASPAVAASAAAAVAAVAAAGGSLPSPRGPVSTNGLPPMASMAMAMGTSTATSAAAAAPPPPPQVLSTAPPPAPTPTASSSSSRDRAPIHSSVPYHINAPSAPLPSLSPTHALSIFAPQPSPDGGLSAYGPAGLFVTAPHHNGNAGSTGLTPHGLVHSPLGCGTPGSLPSLFARGLLAPISTPYDPTKNDFLGFVTSPMVMTPSGTTPLGTPMLTPHSQSGLGPFVDWKSLAPPSMGNTPSNNQHADASAAMAAAMAAAAVAEAAAEAQQYQQQQQQNQQNQQNHHTPVTALYRPSAGQAGASPVKRKSITSKQMAESVATTGPDHGATLAMPIAKSLAALERTHPARKANPRRWTKEEDDALRQAVENHKEKNWKAIAAQVPGRNHTQCLQRWTKVLAPGLVKGHWSPHEDELLKRLVAGGNKNWGEVAAKIPGRTSKQCRERWHNHLDPNIVRGAYSPEEDRIILEAQARLGNRWSVIAAMLPGRTEDAVKIRWKSHCRLWKARKYLRKPGGDEELGPDPEMGGEPEDDSSDDDADEGETGGDMGEQKQTPVMAA